MEKKADVRVKMMEMPNIQAKRDKKWWSGKFYLLSSNVLFVLLKMMRICYSFIIYNCKDDAGKNIIYLLMACTSNALHILLDFCFLLKHKKKWV